MTHFIGLLLLICSTNLWAAPKQMGFKIETALDYQNSGKEIKSQSTFILAKDSKIWTTLTEPKNGVALLGRVVKSDEKSLHFEYIVVDTTKSNVIISTPAINANFGEKAEITVGSDADQEKVTISLLATETTYTSK